MEEESKPILVCLFGLVYIRMHRVCMILVLFGVGVLTYRLWASMTLGFGLCGLEWCKGGRWARGQVGAWAVLLLQRCHSFPVGDLVTASPVHLQNYDFQLHRSTEQLSPRGLLF